MAAISGSAALIALATRLGIPNAAKILADKGFKYFTKYVAKFQKQVTKQKETKEKGFRGKGSQRKQKDITKRKIPTNLSINK